MGKCEDFIWAAFGAPSGKGTAKAVKGAKNVIKNVGKVLKTIETKSGRAGIKKALKKIKLNIKNGEIKGTTSYDDLYKITYIPSKGGFQRLQYNCFYDRKTGDT